MPILTLKHCLICYKEGNPSSTENSSIINSIQAHKLANRNAEVSRRFGTLASRYLNLDPYHFLPDKTLRSKLIVNYDRVCEDCFPQLESFCEIYEQWEFLEMQLTWRLKEVAEIMKIADDEKMEEYVTLRKCFKEKLEKNQMTIEYFNDFRKEFVEEVDQKIKGDFPRLKLKRKKLKGDQDDYDDMFSPIPVNPAQNPGTGSAVTKETDKLPCVINPENDKMENEQVGDDEDFFTIVVSPNQPAPPTQRVPNAHVKRTPPTSLRKKNPRPTRQRGRPRKVDVYICKFCSTRFPTPIKLARHVKRNHDAILNKPFKCQTCPASFTNGYSLINHTRSHTGEKPYACEKCEEKFARLTSLRMHERRIHDRTRIKSKKPQLKAQKMRSSETRPKPEVKTIEPKMSFRMRPVIRTQPLAPMPPECEQGGGNFEIEMESQCSDRTSSDQSSGRELPTFSFLNDPIILLDSSDED